MTIHRILIANRGEIAVRLLRTCTRLGIETVLAASEADINSMAARMADRTICIGPAASADSYLNVDAVIKAALEVKADAIHPGYGFLSENKSLAEACTANSIIFVGPGEAQLDAVGDKLKARTHALAAGMPVVPGGEVNDDEQAKQLADETGYPILLKAVSGGGGRGMKIVSDPERLIDTLHLAMSEAQAAFADSRIYLERYVSAGRHIEIQILADGENVIHLGTRDCSIQRRYQKLVEEAPAPDITDQLRTQMQDAAVGFASYLKYRSLGTIELLMDCERNTFYFLEMNARIQVEHPVTEAICGLDLVEEQIAVAEGQKLRYQQDDIKLTGHAIECRLNAEDWEKDFRPSPGKITAATFPAGENIRIDTHVQKGSMVSPFYDSLLAKLIVKGKDREETLSCLRNALQHVDISGINTTTAMHIALMNDEGFSKGGVNTAYFPQFLEKQLAVEVANG